MLVPQDEIDLISQMSSIKNMEETDLIAQMDDKIESYVDPQYGKEPAPLMKAGGFIREEYPYEYGTPEYLAEKQYFENAAEGEALVEDWTPPAIAAYAATAAIRAPLTGLSLIGRSVYGSIALSTATVAELGIIMPLSKRAGMVHPWLEPIVGLTTGIGSAFTLEALLSDMAIKTLTKSAPKFWTKELGLIKANTNIPDEFFDDVAFLKARNADDGDVEAAKELVMQLHDAAYQKVLHRSDKAAAKAAAKVAAKEVTEESAEKVTKEIGDRIATGGTLDDVDYQRLSAIAERDAIHEYTTEFDKLRRQIIDRQTDALWSEDPSKDIVDYILAHGKLNKNSIRNIFKADPEVGEKAIKLINKKFSKLLTETHADMVPLSRIAKAFDKTDLRKLIADIADSPGRGAIRKSVEAKFRSEFNRIFRDEIFLRTAEKLDKYLAKVIGVEKISLPAAGTARKGSTIVRQAAIAVSKTASWGDVIQELATVRKTIDRMTTIIKTQTQKAATKEGQKRITALRKEHAIKLANFKQKLKLDKTATLISLRLKNALSPKNMLPDFREQLQNFVAPMFGIEQRTLSETMWKFLRRKYDNKYSVGADILARNYDTMLKSVGARPRNLKELTIEQMEDVDAFVKSFVKVAVNEKYIIEPTQRMAVRAIVQNIEATAETSMAKSVMFKPTYHDSTLEELAEGTLTPTGHLIRASSDVMSGIFADLKRMEPILRQLDGFKNFGLAWRQIFDPMVQAEIASHRLGDNVYEFYKKIFKEHRKASKMGLRPSKYWSKLQEPVAGIQTSKEHAISMALHTGNKDNMEVLTYYLNKDALKRGVTITSENIMEYLNKNLTKADWKLVNDIWTHLEKDLWPVISKVYKDVTGATLQQVDGHYFPIQAKKLARAGDEKLTDIFFMADPKKFKAELNKSFMLERIGGTETLNLSLDVLTKHLRDVVHVSTHWKAINDVQKIVSHPIFKRAVEKTMGERIYQQFNPWLKNLARPLAIDPTHALSESMMRRVRGGVTVGVLGAVFTTASKQSLSFITALPEIGIKNAMASLIRFGVNPRRFLKAVTEASPQMAYRIRTWQREIAEMASTINPRDFALKGQAKNLFFSMIHFVDRITASVVWHGAYLKGLDEYAGNAHRAVDFADMIVRKTQPAASAKDLPGIMRGPEWKRAISMFYGYFSVWHNQAAEIISRGLAGNMSKAKVISTLAFLSAAPMTTWSLVSHAGKHLTGREVDDEELLPEMVKAVGVGTMSGLPLVRDVVAGALLSYDFQISPIADIGREAVDVIEGGFAILDEDDEWDRYHTASVIELLGYLFHLPSRQMVTTVEGALRLIEGDTDDPTELLIRASQR